LLSRLAELAEVLFNGASVALRCRLAAGAAYVGVAPVLFHLAAQFHLRLLDVAYRRVNALAQQRIATQRVWIELAQIPYGVVEVADRIGIAAILLLETIQAVDGIAIGLLDILVAHVAAPVTIAVVIRTALRTPLVAVSAAIVITAGVLLAALSALLPLLSTLLTLLSALLALLALLPSLLTLLALLPSLLPLLTLLALLPLLTGLLTLLLSLLAILLALLSVARKLLSLALLALTLLILTLATLAHLRGARLHLLTQLLDVIESVL
jgi:hypothetical protein